jgi:hypothetical protein
MSYLFKFFLVSYLFLGSSCLFGKPSLKTEFESLIPTEFKLQDGFKSWCVYNDAIYLHKSSYEDTLDYTFITKIDIKTGQKTTIKVFFPDMVYMLRTPYSTNIATNDEYLVILYDRLLCIFNKKTKEEYSLKYYLPLQNCPKQLYINNSNKLLMTAFYNAHPLSQNCKLSIEIFNLNTLRFEVNECNQNPDGIAISHFEPNNYFAPTNKLIAVSDALKYKISIRDWSNKELFTLKRDLRYPTINDTLKKITASVEIGHNKELIEKVIPIDDTLARLESLFFKNDSTLMVRHIPSHQKEKNRLRLWDTWSYNSKLNKWELSQKDLEESGKITTEFKLNNNNLPTQSVYSKCAISNGLLIEERRFNGVPFEGLTFKKWQKQIDDKYETVDPLQYFFIFKLK